MPQQPSQRLSAKLPPVVAYQRVNPCPYGPVPGGPFLSFRPGGCLGYESTNGLVWFRGGSLASDPTHGYVNYSAPVDVTQFAPVPGNNGPVAFYRIRPSFGCFANRTGAIGEYIPLGNRVVQGSAAIRVCPTPPHSVIASLR